MAGGPPARSIEVDPKHLFGDVRETSLETCVYCGQRSESIDHVPGKAFLDRPYPDPFPTVPSCVTCNTEQQSQDEEYLAAFLECVVSGSADPADFERLSVARAVGRSAGLRRRLQESATGTASWTPERERVESVLGYLARGHVSYHLSKDLLPAPSSIWSAPIHLLSDSKRSSFFGDTESQSWPEVGTRDFIRATLDFPLRTAGWGTLQHERYSYYVAPSGDLVRILIRGYLAAEIRWA